jgi:hypothetical protein
MAFVRVQGDATTQRRHYNVESASMHVSLLLPFFMPGSLRSSQVGAIHTLYLYSAMNMSLPTCPTSQESQPDWTAMEAVNGGPGIAVHLPQWISVTPNGSASVAVGLAFLRCGGASPPAATRSRKTHVAHRIIKIERVYRPYLTATEAAPVT